MQYLKIDNQGFFLDIVTFNENLQNPNYVDTPCTESFFKTQWVGDWDDTKKQWKPGGKWVEGASEEELSVFKAQFRTESQRDWKNLAIAFHSSLLYNVHLREVTAAADPEWSDKLWWIDKDITIVLTAWFGDELSRTERLKETLTQLFKTLEDAKFPAPEEDKNQIIDALNKYGFSDISKKV